MTPTAKVRWHREDAPNEALAAGGNGPNNPEMNERVAALEARMDAVLPTLATRADIAEVRADIKGWMLGTVIAIIVGIVGALGVLTTVFRAPAQPTTQPIVIQVPREPTLLERIEALPAAPGSEADKAAKATEAAKAAPK